MNTTNVLVGITTWRMVRIITNLIGWKEKIPKLMTKNYWLYNDQEKLVKKLAQPLYWLK